MSDDFFDFEDEDDEEYELDKVFLTRFLPNNRTKVDLLEDYIRQAERDGDDEAAFDARLELVTAATFSGLEEKALVAFTWCLAKWDENPTITDSHSILWPYKWILGHLPSFARVSLDQVWSMADDFEQRLVAHGYTRRAAHDLRWGIAMDIGDFNLARREYEAWKLVPRDGMADCEACEQNQMVRYGVFLREPEEALRHAEPIVDGGMSCSSVPQTTHGHLIGAHLQRGDLESAAEHHRQGYRPIKDDPHYVGVIPDHLFYLIRAGKLDKALKLFNRHLPWFAETTDDRARFEYALAGWVLCETLDEEPAKLKIPEAALRGKPVPTTREECGKLFAEIAEEIANQFDTRNRTGFFGDWIARETRA